LYKVKVNSEEVKEVSSEDPKLSALNILQDGDGGYHIIHQSKSYAVRVLEHNVAEKDLSLLINGNKYNVTIEDEYDALLKSMGMGAGAVKKLKKLQAPMPGLVLEVMVCTGAAVKKDDPLMILEAMKMENVLKSPGDAVVKSIEIEKGLAVEKNQVLIHFE
jgi:acetyl/propionyl-CoA carboxylase alpha subunit